MGSLSIWHWLIVLVVIVLIFGTGKLRNVGKDLGGAVKGFKDGMRHSADDVPTIPVLPHATGADSVASPAKSDSRA